MNEFKQVFNQSQQFLILQAYIDQQLSEEELMNFTLLETVDEVPVVFYAAGMLVIQPNLDLDQFQHTFFSKEAFKLQQKNNQLVVTLSNQRLTFQFADSSEAQQVASDLAYLYSTAE